MDPMGKATTAAVLSEAELARVVQAWRWYDITRHVEVVKIRMPRWEIRASEVQKPRARYTAFSNAPSRCIRMPFLTRRLSQGIHKKQWEGMWGFHSYHPRTLPLHVSTSRWMGHCFETGSTSSRNMKCR
jgi:hypothetical protein